MIAYIRIKVAHKFSRHAAKVRVAEWSASKRCGLVSIWWWICFYLSQRIVGKLTIWEEFTFTSNPHSRENVWFKHYFNLPINFWKFNNTPTVTRPFCIAMPHLWAQLLIYASCDGRDRKLWNKLVYFNLRPWNMVQSAVHTSYCLVAWFIAPTNTTNYQSLSCELQSSNC